MNSPWALVPLSQVLSPISRPERVDPEKSYNILGAHWYAMGLYIKDVLNGSEIRANQLYRVERGDFVYNRLFGWKGSFALATDENDGCHVSNEFPCFIVRSDRADGRYLWRYFSLPSVWDEVLSLSTGGTPTSRNRLKEAQLLAMSIPLPPLDAQHRIVARIEELSAKIEGVRKLRGETTVEINALALDATAHAFPRASDRVVGDFMGFQTGYAFKSEWFTNEGIRLVRNANIGHGNLDWSETERIPAERREEFFRFELQSGDILITLDRPIISTGVKVARVREEDLPCLLLQRVARAQFKTESVLPEYFYSWLRSPHFIDAINPGRSNGVPHISHKDIEKIPFAVPPLSEQCRIVAYLNDLQAKVDVVKKLQEESAEELDALMPSILSRAFSGVL